MTDWKAGTMPRSRRKPAMRSLLKRLPFVALLAMMAAPVAPLQSFAQSMFQPPKPDQDGDYGEGLPPFETEGPLIAVVSTGIQQIRVFDRNGQVAASNVSTGRKGYETPEGVFTIIERKVEHNSNLYDDAPMPFMQRITWSGVALHEGVVPGYRASHGCIRLPAGFAERLFRTTKLSTRVIIVPHDGVPMPITHPVLFQPGPFPQQAAASSIAATDEPPELLDASLPQAPDAPSAGAAATPTPLPVVPAPTGAELKARRVAAEQRLASATKALGEARLAVRARHVEQGQAERALRQATFRANRAESRAQLLSAAVSSVSSEVDVASAVTDHLEALIELAEMRGKEDALREEVAAKVAAARLGLENVKKIETERQTAHSQVRSLARRLSPVTIFVSRQNGRIYVRQATREIMDAAVAIRDADRPLGTHVFTALDADEAADAVKWVALTIATPGDAASAEEVAGLRNPRSEKRKSDVSVPGRDSLRHASLALDRIEIPQAVLARVMPALQPGSTLIVSDLGPSIETGPGTDVVVQTRGEEQAARNIANFQARKRAEAAADAGFHSSASRRRDTGWAGPRYWNRW